MRWFDTNGREFPWRQEGASLYHLILSELLLQRTRAETVAAFFNQFITRFPTWEAIAGSTVEEIGELLKPIGLWRRRASSLLALATAMAARGGEFPRKRAEVETLPGVGQYIANSILLFSAGRAEPLLDVNMARVLERLFGHRKLVDIRDDPHLQSVSRAIVRGKRATELNWAVLDLAANICTIKNPRCEECPLRRNCLHANGSEESSVPGGSGPHETLTASPGGCMPPSASKSTRSRSARPY
ncbi:MAG: hypothetical protein L0Z62_38010 [Gemmataceae bacterium]|nr:hypothetical protein [Gemmataceae bacterium]